MLNATRRLELFKELVGASEWHTAASLWDNTVLCYLNVVDGTAHREGQEIARELSRELLAVLKAMSDHIVGSMGKPIARIEGSEYYGIGCGSFEAFVSRCLESAGRATDSAEHKKGYLTSFKQLLDHLGENHRRTMTWRWDENRRQAIAGEHQLLTASQLG